jgi:hypothetical protein
MRLSEILKFLINLFFQGFFVLLVVFGFSLAANLIFNTFCGKGYYDQHKWPFALSLICSAIACWFLGNHLYKKPNSGAIDTDASKSSKGQTVFFIPLHWWAPLLLLIAVMFFVLEFIQDT